jgi:glycosyltransferase involved in cell wall biosynthesis
MDAQVANGHRVTYFCAGRHYPFLRNDRLHSWSRRGIAMREIFNSSLGLGGGGTLAPEADLHHAPSERLFSAVLQEVSPDIVHIQEMAGLPSSIIDLTKAAGIPVLATLQDYLPLCPTMHLYDVDDQLCLRHDVGAQCARCCASNVRSRHSWVRWTLAYELRRRLPGAAGWRVVGAAVRGRQALRRLAASRRQIDPAPRAAAETRAQPVGDRARAGSPLRYQARRDINIDRLSRLDLLVAQSRRVKEIYAQLGVPADRLRVMQLTLSHLARIVPRTIGQPPGRIHFATLNGCVSVDKGADLILGALLKLHEAGLDPGFRLTVLGGATPETQRRLEQFTSARYEGGYDVATIDHRLAPFDVGIVPSVWEEAYGYVGVEFLAKGIPVIGNRRGGIVDYTREGETGWINADASGEGLATIMANLIRDPRQVLEMHRRVIASRETLIRTMPDHAQEMNGVYQDLVAAKERREATLTRASGASHPTPRHSP